MTDAYADCDAVASGSPVTPTAVCVSVCRVSAREGGRGGGGMLGKRRSINVSGGALECVTVRGAGKALGGACV